MNYEVIELGGGLKPICHPNIDVIESATVDIRCDLSKDKIPLESNSVGKIVSKDFIEHLQFDDFIRLLRECKRVLRIGGHIDFITPDCSRILIAYSSWNEHVEKCFVGNWGTGIFMLHKQWLTPQLMTYILRNEGWEKPICEPFKSDVDYWKEPKVEVIAYK